MVNNIKKITLKRAGRVRKSLTRIANPMSVAMEQCGMVGVKLISTSLRSSSTWVDKFYVTAKDSSSSQIHTLLTDIKLLPSWFYVHVYNIKSKKA